MFHEDSIINEAIFKHDGGLRPPQSSNSPVWLESCVSTEWVQLHAADTETQNPPSACQEVGRWIASHSLTSRLETSKTAHIKGMRICRLLVANMAVTFSPLSPISPSLTLFYLSCNLSC